MYNTWGGPVEIEASVDNDTDSRNLEIDRASVKSVEATQQSWLLGEEEKKKKKNYIDFGCVECSKRFFFTCLCIFLTAGLLAGIVTLIVKTAPRKHHVPIVVDNYTQALHQALKFFDAQRSGPLPKTNNIPWRGDSGLADGNWSGGSGGYPNLIGGYYDAGDNIKYGFPQSFAMTMLSWSVIEYRAKYIATGELDHIRQIIRWGTDYMLKTFNSTAPPGEVDKLWVQVGKGTPSPDPATAATEEYDHTCWVSPEDMQYDRPCWSTTSAPEVAAEMAAALAAASIVFADDQKYSSKLIFGAKSLYDFARANGGRTLYMNAGDPDARNFYNSTGYWDEHLWGAAWLFYATGNITYLNLATALERANNADFANTTRPSYGVLSWDNKLIAVQVLMTRFYILQSPGYPYEDVLIQYFNHSNIVMCSYLPDYLSYVRTKGGLILLDKNNGSGTLFYTVNAVFLATLYADYLDAADIRGWKCGGDFHTPPELRSFATFQMDYILGNNRLGMSYVVGFGKKYPVQVHHRGASLPTRKDGKLYTCHGPDLDGWAYYNTTTPNHNIIYGALVGGPRNSTDDRFKDDRTDYMATEPTLHGNAGLVAALIGLSQVNSPNTPKLDRNTIFSAIPPMYPAPPPPPPPYKP
eukprot:TRINITY_DN220_c0_g1_i1.p1 TRINITY_DN220_c0_g1~~TRINITY_DN220_c0_g1_i1.p1  ORF type:complete len:637 (+),score=97.03 TRINITY_DN220_c0_g1_i1:310-2220(+)